MTGWKKPIIIVGRNKFSIKNDSAWLHLFSLAGRSMGIMRRKFLYC